MKRLLLVFSIVSMAGTPMAKGDSIRLNTPFPTIVLPAVEDATAMSIEQFRGQKLMLHVFASW